VAHQAELESHHNRRPNDPSSGAALIVPIRPLPGTPSDRLPAVLAAGKTDVTTIFVSLSARQAEGRDEDYLEWHSLDHRPEQYRINGLRHSLRLVSTPDCRSRRAASVPRYDPVDHVMTYFFADLTDLEQFNTLSDALPADRRPLTLPSVEMGVYRLTGKFAAPRTVTGADVLPWRPACGVYLLVENRATPPEDLVSVDGVAGAWWGSGVAVDAPFSIDRLGQQISYLFLDEEPEDMAERLRVPLQRRWDRDGTVPELAAAFHPVVPFEWGRYLP
jgi:hypothetical protein